MGDFHVPLRGHSRKTLEVSGSKRTANTKLSGFGEIAPRHETGRCRRILCEELDRLRRDVYMSGRLDKWSSDGELDPRSSKRRASLLPNSAVLARPDPRWTACGRRSHALR